jgi:hypothetical protein
MFSPSFHETFDSTFKYILSKVYQYTGNLKGHLPKKKINTFVSADRKE